MYQAGIEWILRFRLRGTTLHLDPYSCIFMGAEPHLMLALIRCAPIHSELVIEATTC
jgi:hypothetical protein